MYIFSFIDVLPYFLMVLVLTIIMNTKGESKLKAKRCFQLIFIFASIRYGVGYDYFSYKQIVLHQVDQSQIDRFEPFSRSLMEIAYNTHYQVFFALASFLTLFTLYKACLKLSINPSYSLVLYFLFPNFFLDSLSIVRNHIAYVIVLFAYVLLCQRKRLTSLLVILVAFMFHKSAAMGLLIYPIYYLKLGKMTHIILYMASFLISAAVMSAVSAYSEIIPMLSNVERYAETYAKEGGRSMTFIINGLCIFHFILWNRLCRQNLVNKTYLAMFNIAGCIWNVFLFVDSNVALRLSSYFQIFIIFLVPYYKYCVVPPYRLYVRIGSYIFFLLLFVSSFYINISAYLKDPIKMNALPYQTVFYKEDYRNYVD